MTRAANVVYFLSLSVWVGGLITLAAVVAPNVFTHASSAAEAGRIFGPTLRAFGTVELVCAVLLVASGVTLHVTAGGSAWTDVAKLILMGLMVLALVLHVFAVGIPIEKERASIPDFESLQKGDPQRERFDRLHRWSVRLVTANILLGVALLALSSATIRR